ncbi:diablo, IAP-binding mitochondrial protein a [Aplochiton taeniatus]
MAALRRGVACLSFLSKNSASVLINKRPIRQRLGRLTDVTRTSIVSLSVGTGLGAVPIAQLQQADNLTHESLVRRASSMVTDSANTYLSQTTQALVDSLTQYAKALHTLIALQRRYLSSLGKLTPAEEDSIWQVIIGQRVEVDDRLDECNRFEANWINAVNLCEMASEAANKAGAKHASVTVKTNLNIAQSQVEESRKLTQAAEKQLAEAKADEIQRMAEYAALLERWESDLNEAYLRED